MRHVDAYDDVIRCGCQRAVAPFARRTRRVDDDRRFHVADVGVFDVGAYAATQRYTHKYAYSHHDK